MKESLVFRVHLGKCSQVAPKIKELMTLSSRLMVGYNPLRSRRNFFRLTFTCHPVLNEEQVLGMLAAIEDCGEMLRHHDLEVLCVGRRDIVYA